MIIKTDDQLPSTSVKCSKSHSSSAKLFNILKRVQSTRYHIISIIMLVKLFRPTVGRVSPALSLTLSHRLNTSPTSDNTPQSKHNPHAIKDLRGHHNIDELKDSESALSPIHSQKYHYLSAYHISSLVLGNKVAKFIGSLTTSPKSTIAGDSLHLPKIYPDSVAIYDAIEGVNTFLTSNKIISKIAPFNILFIVPEPTLTAVLYPLGVIAYYQFTWKLARNLVIKAELLPQTEEVAYQKISFWGSITTHKAKITDLELTNIEAQFQEYDHSERGVRGLINKEVAFKVKGSGELLLFAKEGVWHQEGLNHALLV